MKIHKGNLIITGDNFKENQKLIEEVEEIEGYLTIGSVKKVSFEKLKTVGRNIHLYENAKLEANKLQTLGGDLYLSENAKLGAKKLQTIRGYLYLYEKAKLEAEKLQTIEGPLSLSENAKLEAEKLQTIRGDLYLYEKAKLEAEKLQTVEGGLCLYEKAKLEAEKLQTVGGHLSLRKNAKLKADKLKTIRGRLDIYTKLNKELEKRLWRYNSKKYWCLDENCSEFLLSRKGNIKYNIGSIPFDKPLFDKVRKDLLTAKEVFAIENVEQRRIAYERMDKAKMKDLKGYKILDEVTDNQNNKMRIVSFKLKGFRKRFLYLDCICPSTGRNYFIETQQSKCEKAKAKSFGLNKITFSEEW